MFRKGGNVGVGIMSEIQDRKSFQIGSNPFENPLQMDRAADQGLLGLREQITEREVPDFGEERDTAYYLDKLKSGLGEDTSFDPFTQYLLTAGPAVAKATSFADAIARLEKPNLALIEAQEARAKRDRDLGLAAADLSIRRGETLEERKQDYEKTQREQDFILKKFKQETDRLLKLQEKDFSQEEKLLGLKFAQEGTMFDRQADLEKNLLKIKAAIDSDLYDKKQKDRFKELEIQYTNALGLLKEEQKPSLAMNIPDSNFFETNYLATVGERGSGQSFQNAFGEPISEEALSMNRFLGLDQGDSYWNFQTNTRDRITADAGITQFIGSYI